MRGCEVRWTVHQYLHGTDHRSQAIVAIACAAPRRRDSGSHRSASDIQPDFIRNRGGRVLSSQFICNFLARLPSRQWAKALWPLSVRQFKHIRSQIFLPATRPAALPDKTLRHGRPQVSLATVRLNKTRTAAVTSFPLEVRISHDTKKGRHHFPDCFVLSCDSWNNGTSTGMSLPRPPAKLGEDRRIFRLWSQAPMSLRPGFSTLSGITNRRSKSIVLPHPWQRGPAPRDVEREEPAQALRSDLAVRMHSNAVRRTGRGSSPFVRKQISNIASPPDDAWSRVRQQCWRESVRDHDAIDEPRTGL